MTINDLTIPAPLAVFDTRSERVIFRSAGHEKPDDIPPDVASLRVLRIYAVDDVVYIDTDAG